MSNDSTNKRSRCLCFRRLVSSVEEGGFEEKEEEDEEEEDEDDELEEDDDDEEGEDRDSSLLAGESKQSFIWSRSCRSMFAISIMTSVGCPSVSATVAGVITSDFST